MEDSLVFARRSHSWGGVTSVPVVKDLEAFECGVGQVDSGAPSGHGPASADAAGLYVGRMRYAALGGAAAGAGGGYLTLRLFSEWFDDMTAGMGWLAAILVILASLALVAAPGRGLRSWCGHEPQIHPAPARMEDPDRAFGDPGPPGRATGNGLRLCGRASVPDADRLGRALLPGEHVTVPDLLDSNLAWRHPGGRPHVPSLLFNKGEST